MREKMVEVVSDKFICIVDESKLSKVREKMILKLTLFEDLNPLLLSLFIFKSTKLIEFT